MKTWDKGAASDALDEEVLEFLSGKDILFDQQLVQWDALTLMAHDLMLQKIGILSKEEAAAILKELLHIHENGLSLSIEHEDVHGNIEALLIKKLGGAGKKARTGLSRNDEVLACLKLYMKHELLETMQGIVGLCAVLEVQASKYQNAIMPGYTHHQQAMPYTFGSLLMSYYYSLLDDIDALLAAYETINKNPLGSGAGFGVPLPLDKKMTAALLGFDASECNALYHIAGRGKQELLVAQALGQLMLTLNRMAQDCILFSMKEFSFISLPEGFATGSSIMPQKRNPDVCEVLKGKASRVLANTAQIELTIKNLPSGYHRDGQETKGALMECFSVSKQSVVLMKKLFSGIVVHEDAMKAAMDNSIYATHYALSSGKPYKEAYQAAAQKIATGEPFPEFPVAADLGSGKQALGKKEALISAKEKEFDQAITALLDAAEKML